MARGSVDPRHDDGPEGPRLRSLADAVFASLKETGDVVLNAGAAFSIIIAALFEPFGSWLEPAPNGVE